MKIDTRDLSTIALFPALMGATAGLSIPLLNLPPITLQTLFVFLAGFYLSPKNAGVSMFIYVLLGIIGVPVFSGYTGGLGVLLVPSGGFLLGFVILAVLVAYLNQKLVIDSFIIKNAIIIFVGTLILYMLGASYISILYHLPYFSVIVGFTPYLIGDILKGIAVIGINKRLTSRFTYE